MTARDALGLMREHGFSQLPVVAEEKVIGVFSYRSFAHVVEATRNERDVASLPVVEFLDRPQFVHTTDPFDEILDELDGRGAVLVGARDRLVGIATPMDILRYLYEVANAYVLLQEIELAMRELIRLSLTPEQLAESASRCLAGAYAEGRVPHTLGEMTFSDYVTILGRQQTWHLFEPLLGVGSRERVRSRLNDVREIRNVAFHFRRKLSAQDYEQLRAARDRLFVGLDLKPPVPGNDRPTTESPAVTLTRQQKKLVTRVLTSESPVRLFLEAPPGFGKTVAACHIGARLIDDLPDAPILFVGPSTLQADTAAKLEAVLGHQPISLTKRLLREKVEHGEHPYNAGSAVVLEAPLIKQPDVLNWLVQSKWRLIVVEEAQGLSRGQQDGVRRLVESNPQAHLLLTGVTRPEGEFLPEVTPVVWTRDRTSMQHDRASELVTYQPTPEEIQVADLAHRVAEQLDGSRANLFLHRMSSSLHTFEASVAELLEEDSVPPALADDARRIARLLEGLTKDAKAARCIEVVRAIRERGNSVVVFTAYRDTARYAFDLLREVMSDVYLFAGKQDDDRSGPSEFLQRGGVAVVTDASIGSRLDRPDLEGVAFDPARTMTGWDRRWRHVDRVGRTGDARMHILIGDPALKDEVAGLKLAGIEA